MREIYASIAKRSDSECNFVDASSVLSQWRDESLTIVYRKYATLYFVLVVDDFESKLGLWLKLIVIETMVFQ